MHKLRLGFWSFFLAIVLLSAANIASQAQNQDPFSELPAGGDILSSVTAHNPPNSIGDVTAFCTTKKIFTRSGPFESVFWTIPPEDGEIYKMSLKTGKDGKSFSLLVLTTTGKVLLIPLAFLQGFIIIPSSQSVLEFDPIAQYRYNKIVGDDIYVQTTSGLIFVTSNDSTWGIDTAGLGSGVNDIVLDTSQDVFTVTNSGFYMQAPSERSWHFLSNASSGIYFLFVNHADILYAATSNGLIMSADHGVTWAFDTAGMGVQLVDHMSDDSVGNLYATSSYGSNAHYVWMKPHGGAWRSIGAALKNLAYDSVEQLSEDYLTGITVDSGIHVATSFGLFSSYDGGGTWKPDNKGITGGNIYGFYQFPDWRRIATTDLGLFTENAGDTTWAKSFPQNSYFPGINFFVDNAERLYALGVSRWNQFLNGNQILTNYFPRDIFVSSDKGSTWASDTTGLSQFGSPQGNYSMEFVDETGTEHIATYEQPYMRLFSKVTGGSWQGDSGGYTPQSGDEPSAFATDHHGSIYLTLNNGSSAYKLLKRATSGGAWSEVPTSALGGTPYVFTATKDGKLIGGGANDSTGYYDGSTWTVIPKPPGFGKYGFAFSVDSSNRLWAAYGLNQYYAPYIFSTTDLGQHWTSESDTSPTFASMVSFGDTTYGLNSGNGLWYFVQGSASVLETSTQNFGISIIPNPSKGAADISLRLNHRSDMRVTIFNVLGEEVTIPLARTLDPGSYRTSFDLSGLAAGTYYCRIQADGVVETQKLILEF